MYIYCYGAQLGAYITDTEQALADLTRDMHVLFTFHADDVISHGMACRTSARVHTPGLIRNTTSCLEKSSIT